MQLVWKIFSSKIKRILLSPSIQLEESISTKNHSAFQNENFKIQNQIFSTINIDFEDSFIIKKKSSSWKTGNIENIRIKNSKSILIENTQISSALQQQQQQQHIIIIIIIIRQGSDPPTLD